MTIFLIYAAGRLSVYDISCYDADLCMIDDRVLDEKQVTGLN